MSVHTALLDLPDVLVGLGLNVVVSDGWEQGQCKGTNHYLWTDPDSDARSHSNPPSGYMVHHTGSPEPTSATIPPVRTSKAGAWIGLLRSDGTLHHKGGGQPTIALVTAGPARISSGFGFPPSAWDHTFKDKRAPWQVEGPDDAEIALNRYTFNVETVHPGTGAEIDTGVWEHVVGLGIALHQMFGWNERTLGHVSWTRRKNDPQWRVGAPNDGRKCIIDIQDAIASRQGTSERRGTPEMYIPITLGSTRIEDVKWLQLALNRAGADPVLTIDGAYGPATQAAVSNHQEGDGSVYGPASHDALLAAAYDRRDTVG